jgi:hypothetical protein
MFNVALRVNFAAFSIISTCIASESELLNDLARCLIQLIQSKKPHRVGGCRSAKQANRTTKPNWISAQFGINHSSSPPVFCALTVKNDCVG